MWLTRNRDIKRCMKVPPLMRVWTKCHGDAEAIDPRFRRVNHSHAR
jgi:hypothetical protein